MYLLLDIFKIFSLSSIPLGGCTPSKGPIDAHRLERRSHWLALRADSYDDWLFFSLKDPAPSFALGGLVRERGSCLWNAIQVNIQ